MARPLWCSQSSCNHSRSRGRRLTLMSPCITSSPTLPSFNRRSGRISTSEPTCADASRTEVMRRTRYQVYWRSGLNEISLREYVPTWATTHGPPRLSPSSCTFNLRTGGTSSSCNPIGNRIHDIRPFCPRVMIPSTFAGVVRGAKVYYL